MRPTRRSALPTSLLLAGFFLSLSASPPSAGARDETVCQRLQEDGLKILVRAEKEADPARRRQDALAAAQLFDRAVRLCPEDPEHRFWLGTAYIFAREVGSYQATFEGLKRVALAQDPRIPFLEAHFHLALGNRPGLAVELLQKLRARHPRFMESQVQVLLYKARLELADAMVTKALTVRSSPDSGIFRDAITQLRLAAQESSHSVRRRYLALRNLAQVLRLSSEYDEAERVFRSILSQDPEDPVVRYGLATVLADQHNHEEAAKWWEETLRLIEKGALDPRENSRLEDSRLRYGVTLGFVGRHDDSRRELERYVKEQGQDTRGWYYLGLLAMDHYEDGQTAARHLEKARQLAPECEEPLRALLELYSTLLPDAERAKRIEATLEDEEQKKLREQKRDENVRNRPDRTEGCR